MKSIRTTIRYLFNTYLYNSQIIKQMHRGIILMPDNTIITQKNYIFAKGELFEKQSRTMKRILKIKSLLKRYLLFPITL